MDMGDAPIVAGDGDPRGFGAQPRHFVGGHRGYRACGEEKKSKNVSQKTTPGLGREIARSVQTCLAQKNANRKRRMRDSSPVPAMRQKA